MAEGLRALTERTVHLCVDKQNVSIRPIYPRSLAPRANRAAMPLISLRDSDTPGAAVIPNPEGCYRVTLHGKKSSSGN
jgi:hypothetical protein